MTTPMVDEPSMPVTDLHVETIQNEMESVIPIPRVVTSEEEIEILALAFEVVYF